MIAIHQDRTSATNPTQISSSPLASCTLSEFLPLEIYREIKEWLNEKEYFLLLNTSKRYSRVKWATRRITLKHIETHHFVGNEEFRQKILSKISSPYSQLRLIIEDDIEVDTSLDWEVIRDIKCSLEKYNESIDPAGWYRLLDGRKSICCYTYPNPMPDNTVISNVIKLQIHFFLPQAIYNIASLSLNQCRLNDLQFFQNCRQLTELKLYSCSGLQSLRGLEMISSSLLYLEIYSLPDLRDISTISFLKLRNCEVSSCKLIEDYHPLTSSGHRRIDLRPETSVKINYSSFLTTTRSLCLRDSNLLSLPESPFSSLYFLQLIYCDNLSDLSTTLYWIPFLEVIGCKTIQDISGLGGHQYVKVSGCHGITDFSSLRNVPSVYLYYCNGFLDGNQVKNVKHLIVERCEYFRDPSPFDQVNELGLKFLTLKSLVGLYAVPIVELVYVKCEDGFHGIGGNQRIKFLKSDFKEFKENDRDLFLKNPNYCHEDVFGRLIFYRKNSLLVKE